MTTNTPEAILNKLADLLETRLPSRGGDPSTSYVAKLFSKGPEAALKKIGEEATELARREGVSGLAEKASRTEK